MVTTMPDFVCRWLESWEGQPIEKAFDSMTPQIAKYIVELLDSGRGSISMRIVFSDIREHPVFALLSLEEPTLGDPHVAATR